MSIDCACDVDFGGDFSWYWTPEKERPLPYKRGRRCCSCKTIIKPQETAFEFYRWREWRHDIEYQIHGDDVPLASWWHCAKCYKLQQFITGMNWCFSLGDNLKEELNRAGE